MRIFVAGHRGLVGSSIVRSLPPEYTLVTKTRSELQLEDKTSVARFFAKENIDSVILAAAKVGGISANSSNQRDFLVDNLNIQNSVLMAAAEVGVTKLAFLGSSCIYPKFAPQPISEASLLTGPLEETNDGYAIAKIAGIRLAKAIHDQNGFNYFSLMPTNLYGPNDNFDLVTSHVPAALMRRFYEAKIENVEKLVVWGSGLQRREFMHVDDLASACWHMLSQETNGQLFNVGTGVDLEIREFSELMAQIVGYTGRIEFDKTKPEGTPRKLLDVSKIQSYGWKHKIDLEVGLRRTFEWFESAYKKGVLRGI